MTEEQRTEPPHLWAVKHPYYCEDINFYAPANDQPHSYFKTLASFLDAFGDADPDYNFLFRWDWIEARPANDPFYRNGILKTFWMGQSKGQYFYAAVEVCRADEPEVIKFLAPRWDYMRRIWGPISCAPSASGLNDR